MSPEPINEAPPQRRKTREKTPTPEERKQERLQSIKQAGEKMQEKATKIMEGLDEKVIYLQTLKDKNIITAEKQEELGVILYQLGLKTEDAIMTLKGRLDNLANIPTEHATNLDDDAFSQIDKDHLSLSKIVNDLGKKLQYFRNTMSSYEKMDKEDQARDEFAKHKRAFIGLASLSANKPIKILLQEFQDVSALRPDRVWSLSNRATKKKQQEIGKFFTMDKKRATELGKKILEAATDLPEDQKDQLNQAYYLMTGALNFDKPMQVTPEQTKKFEFRSATDASWAFSRVFSELPGLKTEAVLIPENLSEAKFIKFTEDPTYKQRLLLQGFALLKRTTEDGLLSDDQADNARRELTLLAKALGLDASKFQNTQPLPEVTPVENEKLDTKAIDRATTDFIHIVNSNTEDLTENLIDNLRAFLEGPATSEQAKALFDEAKTVLQEFSLNKDVAENARQALVKIFNAITTSRESLPKSSEVEQLALDFLQMMDTTTQMDIVEMKLLFQELNEKIENNKSIESVKKLITYKATKVLERTPHSKRNDKQEGAMDKLFQELEKLQGQVTTETTHTDTSTQASSAETGSPETIASPESTEVNQEIKLVTEFISAINPSETNPKDKANELITESMSAEQKIQALVKYYEKINQVKIADVEKKLAEQLLLKKDPTKFRAYMNLGHQATEARAVILTDIVGDVLNTPLTEEMIAKLKPNQQKGLLELWQVINHINDMEVLASVPETSSDNESSNETPDNESNQTLEEQAADFRLKGFKKFDSEFGAAVSQELQTLQQNGLLTEERFNKILNSTSEIPYTEEQLSPLFRLFTLLNLPINTPDEWSDADGLATELWNDYTRAEKLEGMLDGSSGVDDSNSNESGKRLDSYNELADTAINIRPEDRQNLQRQASQKLAEILEKSDDLPKKSVAILQRRIEDMISKTELDKLQTEDELQSYKTSLTGLLKTIEAQIILYNKADKAQKQNIAKSFAQAIEAIPIKFDLEQLKGQYSQFLIKIAEGKIFRAASLTPYRKTALKRLNEIWSLGGPQTLNQEEIDMTLTDMSTILKGVKDSISTKNWQEALAIYKKFRAVLGGSERQITINQQPEDIENSASEVDPVGYLGGKLADKEESFARYADPEESTDEASATSKRGSKITPFKQPKLNAPKKSSQRKAS